MLMIPRTKRRQSMRQRLLLGMLAGFIAILSIISIGLWRYADNAANQSYDRLLSGAALVILEHTFLTTEGISVDIPYSAMETVGLARDDRVFYRIYSQNGTTITGDSQLPLPDVIVNDKIPYYFDAWYSLERAHFIVQSRLLTEGSHSDTVIVQIGHTRRARNSLRTDLIVNGFSIALIVTLVGLFFIWIGINRALHPLIAIEEDLRQREVTDFKLLQVKPPREIASLISSINAYIQRLKNSLEHSQNFIADVTHQTRTSLGTLQGQLGLATQETSLEAMRERLQRADCQVQRTIRLNNQLLSHAMVIHRADKQETSKFSLVDLARSTLEQIVRDQIHSHIEFEFILEDLAGESDIISGDPISLREALRNLLDNAVRHGPATNKIDVRICNHQIGVSLIVDDKGPGIAKDKHKKVLERFYSDTQGHTGSGLGLAIVNAVALSHKAILSLQNSQSGGLRVRLDFNNGGLE